MAVGTWQIGRIGLAAANGGDGYSFEEPSEISQDGDSLAVSGFQQETTIAKLTWLRDQILGLTDQVGETAVPVRFSDYAHLNGYYKVQSTSANRSPGGLAWSAALERITDWVYPRVDHYIVGGLLSNSHSVTTGYLVYMVPAGAYWDTIAAAGLGTRSTGDSVSIDYESVSGTSGAQNVVTSYNVDPQYWYRGGCRIEYDVADNGTFYEVVGRRSFTTDATTGQLRLSNGVVRVAWDSTAGEINCWWWDGSAWDGPTAFTPAISTVDQTAIAAAVLRNNADEVSVRYTLVQSGVTTNAVYLDITLRRGSRNVVCYGQSRAVRAWRMRFTTSTSCTSITGGLRRTSDNAGGNRELLVSQNATTITTGTGMVTQASTFTSGLFAIGCEVGGSGAAGINTAANQSAEFFYPLQQTSRVVAV